MQFLEGYLYYAGIWKWRLQQLDLLEETYMYMQNKVKQEAV